MRYKGIFITGTDTGVGKTYIAVRIVRELVRRGIDTGVMKPAETGCARREGKLHPADAVRLRKASGTRDSIALINPFRFRKPLAPMVAAALEGNRIDPSAILGSFEKLRKRHQFMVVEGAGGLMVPLTDRYSFLDLAADLHLPVIIVARPGLGTINHTVLTIQALKGKQAPIAGIVINYADSVKNGLAEKTNPAVIEEISGVRVLGVVQHGSQSMERIVEKIVLP